MSDWLARLRPLATPRQLVWLAGAMLVVWAPLPGEQRLPGFILFFMGLVYWLREHHAINRLPGVRLFRFALLMLLLPALFSMATTLGRTDSIKVIIVLVLSYWSGLALLYGLQARPLHHLGVLLGLAFALWIADALLQWHLGTDLFGIQYQEARVTGPFNNLRMGVLLGVCMPLVLLPASHRWPLASLAAWGLMTFVIGLSGARASLVFALLAGIALFAALPARRYRVLMLLAALLALGVAWRASPELMERTEVDARIPVNPGLERLHGDGWLTRADNVLSGRVTIWITGLAMFRAEPLTGIGAGAFDSAYDRHSPQADDPFRSDGPQPISHAHQLYVSAAAETGLLGLAALAALIVASVRWYRSLPAGQRQRAWPYACSLAIALFPLNSQPGLFIGWWYLTLLLLFCAMLVAGEGEVADQATDRSQSPSTAGS